MVSYQKSANLSQSSVVLLHAPVAALLRRLLLVSPISLGRVPVGSKLSKNPARQPRAESNQAKFHSAGPASPTFSQFLPEVARSNCSFRVLRERYFRPSGATRTSALSSQEKSMLADPWQSLLGMITPCSSDSFASLRVTVKLQDTRKLFYSVKFLESRAPSGTGSISARYLLSGAASASAGGPKARQSYCGDLSTFAVLHQSTMRSDEVRIPSPAPPSVGTVDSLLVKQRLDGSPGIPNPLSLLRRHHRSTTTPLFTRHFVA